jgi:NAD-dependent protein deacetylase/lipoamidase
MKTAKEKILIGPEDRVFVLTGAGVSAESGIPTFRASDGLWAGYRIEDVCTPEAWERNPAGVWDFYAARRKAAFEASPNPGHIALAKLEEGLEDRFFLCTQNVDDLHERAGSKRLVHMHGELAKARCEADCGAAPVHDRKIYRSFDEVGRCGCGARLRPHIVFFGEIPMEMDHITYELDRCTALIVVGTSGNVYPAANFVQWAGRASHSGTNRMRKIYIGPEKPMNAAAFTNIVLGKAGEALPGLFEVDGENIA